ncbi:hypothetical protein E8E14_007895 [Neopestalotiopsis sp. 37M]|nr:hypothetical protein E8E14_007895 [Neopestalotiopsis sp. 37M]
MSQIFPNGDEIFQLSDTGAQILSMYVWLVDVFELSKSINRENIIANLTKGLERALGDHPELMGTMHFDNVSKRIIIKKTEEATAALHIKDATRVTEEEDRIPSYAWLHEHDYPVHRLEIAQVIPAEAAALPMIVAKDLDTPGPVVAAFQATFIEGGVIIGTAISHQVSDGLGVDAFNNTWAAYSKEATTGQPANLDPEIPSFNMFTAARKPGPEEWESLRGKFPTMKYNLEPFPAPPADFVPPVVTTRVFHFPKSKLEKLKAECSVGLPAEGINFVSSYDAVAALWWRVQLRARQPWLKFDNEAVTHAIHSVNMRMRGDEPISRRFIGASVAIPWSEPLTVGQVLQGPRETTLPLLARTVRSVTRQVTPAFIREQMAWGAGYPDQRWTELDLPWVRGHNCMGIGWHAMNPYTAHDYGFGPPTGFRWPQMAFESFFFMMPSRAGTKGARPDEGMEVTFSAEESCFPRIEADEELLAYCEQRGIGS